MKLLGVGAILLFAALQAGAQDAQPTPKDANGAKGREGNCGLLYGKDHSLTFCAPGGWTLDNGIMNDQGIYAAFYPDGSNWERAKKSGTIMYINVVARAADSTVEKLIASDADEARQSAPATVVATGDPIKIGDLSAPVQRFAPGAFKRYEAVAYILEDKVLVMFVMSSKDEKTYKKDYPAFVALVQSYKFLTSNVHVQHHE